MTPDIVLSWLPLAGIRKAAGMTQVQVAGSTGMAQGDVSRLEDQQDTTSWREGTLASILRQAHVSADDLSR